MALVFRALLVLVLQAFAAPNGVGVVLVRNIVLQSQAIAQISGALARQEHVARNGVGVALDQIIALQRQVIVPTLEAHALLGLVAQSGDGVGAHLRIVRRAVLCGGL